MTKHFSSLRLWEDEAERSAAGQMACDEALARLAGYPVLRVYRWADPAATFGYSQRFGELPKAARALNPVRRWTGGGVVYHGDDLTLALVFPSTEELAGKRSDGVYRAIHEAWVGVLRSGFPGARLVLAEECRGGGVCFESPVEYDIGDGVRKICGGALRRFRGGVLYQGSLHCPGLACRDLAEALAGEVGRFEEIEEIKKAAAVLERDKYGTVAWRDLR